MLKKRIGLLSSLLALTLSLTGSLLYAAPTVDPTTCDDYLHTSGRQILDANGKEVFLTGIAWFGFETSNCTYHGLWAQNMEYILDTIANQGFNLMRVPISVQLVNEWRQGRYPATTTISLDYNPNLAGKNSLEVLDYSIAYCKKIGLKIMLDMHRINHNAQSPLWYEEHYTAEDFEKSWQWLTEHFKNDDTVIAMDVFNEPHGKTYFDGDQAAIWDNSTSPNNWKYEVEKLSKMILEINPNLLIMVEGIESYPKPGYNYQDKDKDHYYGNWWGGNLRGVADYPINLGVNQNKLVYAPHDYGPSVFNQAWFYAGFNKETLYKDVWYDNWFFIYDKQIAPLLIGEWGGKMDGGDNEKWMTSLASLIDEHRLNHTFWCINPNSGDTKGILNDDWTTIDTVKYNAIKSTLWQDETATFIGLDHQVPLGANGTNVSEYYGLGGATVRPANVSFDKMPELQADLTVTYKASGKTLKSITNGTTVLRSGTDYTVASDKVTLKKSYLATLPLGLAELTLNFDETTQAILKVKVVDSRIWDGKLKLQMFNIGTNSSSGNISPKFKLSNVGSTSLNLSKVKLRYYYTIDGEKVQNFWCDWSTVTGINVTGSFVKMATPKNGADYYLEIGFTSAAGVLAPGKSIEVQTRFAKADWSNYQQTGDYSFLTTASNYVDSDKVTVYVDNTLFCGIEP